MKTPKIFVLLMMLVIISCDSKKKDFTALAGTWVSIDWQYDRPVVKKMQIIDRSNYYIIGINYIGSDIHFLIGKPNKDHLVVTASPIMPSPSYPYNEKLLTHSFDLYYDKKLNCIFFLNTMYKPSKDNLFERKVNVDGNIYKEELKF